MKSIVIYFSQTGNTEKVARAIQTGITQVTAQCDLQEIRDTNPLRLKDYDLIGLGSPVFGGCPKNVLQFARHLRFVGGKHAFSFCTHGTMHEGFLPTLYPALADRGLTVIGSADWYGDCYLLHMPQPYPTAGIRMRSTSKRPRPSAERWPCAACASGLGKPTSYPRPPRPPLRPRRSLAIPGQAETLRVWSDHLAGCSSSTRRSASIRAAHCAWTTAPCTGWTSLLIRPS